MVFLRDKKGKPISGFGRKAGLTTIEVLLAITLFAAVAAMTAPFAGRTVGGGQVSATAERVTDALRQAQFGAMNGRNPGRFGVRFEPDRFTYFSGPSYSPADPENVVTVLDGGVSISHSLSGNDEVVFGNHLGRPSASGTVTVTADSGQSQTVTVGSDGLIGR
ncbi:hypothetical protein JW899_03075 [Candidatus Uhrbacteria bacterium]|nr:hypothetical protein [Candidatus Uhrbacteria bacterium]